MEWLKEKPGAALRFRKLAEQIEAGEVSLLLSEFTIGEVYYLTRRDWGLQYAEKMLEMFDSLPVTIFDAPCNRIMEAAALKSTHKISYADAFVAALAIEFDCPVVTGDPDFYALAQRGVLKVQRFGN